ncbi:MAG TPA: hypothetical protein VFG16_36090, partial [Streptomyces sp.]|nr:hypothetical protein [Streptomyces sp.]
TAQFKQGALDNLSRMVIIARSYDIKDWKPENAKANMQKAIQAIGAGKCAPSSSAARNTSADRPGYTRRQPQGGEGKQQRLE